MTISAFLSSVLTGHAPHAQAADRAPDEMNSSTTEESLRRLKAYRESFPMTEIAVPGLSLRSRAIAKWVTDHRARVDVHTGEELAVAIAAGVKLTRLTVHADALRESDLCAAVNLGVGRVVTGSFQQIELLRSTVAQRAQDVVIKMTDSKTHLLAVAHGDSRHGFRFDSNESDTAVAAVLDDEWLNLIGLHCEVGSQDDEFISYSSAIGHMVAEMAYIRRDHGVVLTRLSLAGGHAVPGSDWSIALPTLASQLDETLDDACGTLRFPRPLVVLSAALDIIGQGAA